VVKVALCNRSRTDAIVKIDVDAARPSAFRVRHHQVPICLLINFNGKIMYTYIYMPCALPYAVRDGFCACVWRCCACTHVHAHVCVCPPAYTQVCMQVFQCASIKIRCASAEN
jgi:hypothetical protein